MIYVEAPETTTSTKRSLFLAGGITGGPDWQKELLKELEDLDIVIYNPRRKNFDVKDPTASEKQITWEHEALRKADVISFWFFKYTMCPICLYELGAHSMTNKPIIVGVEPGYSRKQDVEIQTKLVRPDIKIVTTIKDLAKEIRNIFENKKEAGDWVDAGLRDL